MGADIKALRTRIKSVSSTLHLTKAMGLVASSKIRRANEHMLKSRQYAAAVEETVALLAACGECRKSPYMRQGGDKTMLVVIAGDRGLAGGYNANIFRLLREFPDAAVTAIGKRACDRAGEAFVSSEGFSYADALETAKTLCARFAAGEFDRLGILCTRYVSMMSQVAEVRWILPLTAEKKGDTGVIFEPDAATILDAAVPTFVAGKLFAAVKESFACEVAARRVAMDAAGKNAQTMIDELQLQYNRARQSTITQEITEIVAGS